MNIFADEVKNIRKGSKAATLVTSEAAGSNDDNGDFVSDEKARCTDSWTADKATKSTRSTTALGDVFEQTGVFLVTCRHGIVEFVAEMIQSGEL